MKNNIHLFVSSLALAGVIILYTLQSSEQSNSKIAFVETMKLLENYPPMKKLTEEVKLRTTVAQARIDSINFSIEAAFMNLEKNKGQISDKEQEEQHKALQKKRINAQNYAERLKMKLEQDNQEGMKDLMNEINAAIKTYGKEKDYKIILGASGNGNLAYADEAINITEDLIENLNSNL